MNVFRIFATFAIGPTTFALIRTKASSRLSVFVDIAKSVSVQAQLEPKVPPTPPVLTRFLELVFPDQANHYGTLFGGAALSLMGKAAFVAATRTARSAVVMAASDKVDFHMPVRVGQLVELDARVTRMGRSSMTVAVEVFAETLLTGERQLAMRGSFEMVAVDSEGRPIAVAKRSPSISEAIPT